jgi:protein N-lysine methyltransferase METTL21A
MSLNDIARDELLDLLDPLRHLMQQHELNDTDTASDSESSNLLSVLPRQSHSVQNEIHALSFVNHACQLPITITLSVDASPGCGGIAWPAGQVRTLY